MNHLLNKLCNYGCLDEEQAYVTLSQMMDGNCDDNQIAAFLTPYGITMDELVSRMGGYI